MGLTPLKEAELPRLGQISLQRQDTYAAYALNLRLTNNNSVERQINATVYRVDKESYLLLLSNLFLK